MKGKGKKTMEKMTKKEMFANIKSLLAGNDEVVAFCDNEIALLEKKAAKAKETAAKKRAEGDELTDVVFAAVSKDNFEPIAEIAARIEGPDVTVAKVTYRLTQLVKSGKIEKTEVSIPGAEGVKARKVMAYRAL